MPSLAPLARTLPASWYFKEEHFELEKRALFSKVWHLVTHTNRFSKAGDYLSFELAGMPFFLSMDKEGRIKGFHNACRHRASPIVDKKSGSALVVACPYHGWCYSTTTGKLTKAPKFDQLPGFSKPENSLFPIHVHTLQNGFIFVNLSADTPASFSSHFGQLEEEWQGFNKEEYTYAFGHSREEDYNWKTLVDGYAECLHCSIVHPGLARAIDCEKYKVENFDHWARHTAPENVGPKAKRAKGEREGSGPPFFTHILPATGVIKADALFYIFRMTPISATKTRSEWQIFGRRDLSLEEVKEINQFYLEIQEEDIDLCLRVQRNIKPSGVYTSGILHPEREVGVAYYQQVVRQACLDHLHAEQTLGKRIYPALPLSQREEEELDYGGNGAACLGAIGASMMDW